MKISKKVEYVRIELFWYEIIIDKIDVKIRLHFRLYVCMQLLKYGRKCMNGRKEKYKHELDSLSGSF